MSDSSLLMTGTDFIVLGAAQEELVSAAWNAVEKV